MNAHKVVAVIFFSKKRRCVGKLASVAYSDYSVAIIWLLCSVVLTRDAL